MPNPYFIIHQKIQQRKSGQWIAVPLLASCLVAGFLAQSSLLHFKYAADISSGFSGLAFRLSILISTIIVMRSYQEIIRGVDREILDPHPIQPSLLLRAIALRALKQTWSFPIAIWALAWPLGFELQNTGIFIGKYFVSSSLKWVPCLLQSVIAN